MLPAAAAAAARGSNHPHLLRRWQAARALLSQSRNTTATTDARRPFAGAAASTPADSFAADLLDADANDNVPRHSAPTASPRIPTGSPSRNRAVPALERYGRDLTEDARRGLLDPVLGRDDVLRRALQVLCRRTKNNPILLGDAGVGKTAVAEGLAQMMAASRAAEAQGVGTVVAASAASAGGDGSAPSATATLLLPPALRGKRLVQLDVAAIVAGASFRGQFEERLRAVLHDVDAAKGGVVLFVDEIHTLVGTGNAEGGLDLANLLKPALARGRLQLVGATTPDEYRKHIEPDPALARRFQPVLVEEPSPSACEALLLGLAPRYEAFHRVAIPLGAVRAAVSAAKRFVSDRRLPDSAIDLVDESAARVALRASAERWHGGRGDGAAVVGTPRVVATVVAAAVPPPSFAPAAATTALSASAAAAQARGQVEGAAPKPCPHCGTLVTPPSGAVRLQCPSCGARFLNVPPERLALGTTVLLREQAAAAMATTEAAATAEATTTTPPTFASGSVPAGVDHVAAKATRLALKHDAAAEAAAAERAAAADEEEAERRAAEAAAAAAAAAASSSSSSVALAEWPAVQPMDVYEVVASSTGIPLAAVIAALQAEDARAAAQANGGGDDSASPSLSSSSADPSLSHLADTLKSVVFGQDRAVDAVASALRLARLGLQHEADGASGAGAGDDATAAPPTADGATAPSSSAASRRAAATLLLLGPDGVGKTTLARALAAALLPGEPAARLVLPMGEYGERHSVARLIGAPPGYVGYGAGGLLTEALRRRPHSVVVLDDAHRAHPDVLALLLQALEEGSLRDSAGHSASLASATFVFTAETARGPAAAAVAKPPASSSSSSSSVSSSSRQAAAAAAARAFSSGGGGAGGGAAALGATEEEEEDDEDDNPPATATSSSSSCPTATTTPILTARHPGAAEALAELAARVDEVVPLGPLSARAMRQLVDARLEGISRAARARLGVVLEVDEAARRWLASAGWSDARGARPLARQLRRWVLRPLAEMAEEGGRGGGGALARARVVVVAGEAASRAPGAAPLELLVVSSGGGGAAAAPSRPQQDRRGYCTQAGKGEQEDQEEEEGDQDNDDDDDEEAAALDSGAEEASSDVSDSEDDEEEVLFFDGPETDDAINKQDTTKTT